MTSRRGDELVFVPLGGAGEIGMNLNLYGFGPSGDETWLMVDLGVTFSDGSLPGVDIIMPDPAFIAERRGRLAGLLLTHAHEDHLGAVPYLWDRLRCPVYATPFTAAILRRKLGEAIFEETVEINEVELGSRFQIGPFDLELITLTHSIPEPNAVAIRCGLGTVLHTGDWKFDPDPVVGPAADEDALRHLGDEGVLAVVGDSTNVFTPGVSGSEADLLDSLRDLIAGCRGRVAIACFASNVARLHTIAAAARANERDVVLAGRSLLRIEAAARETGYMDDVPAFIAEDDAGYLPEDKIAIICTGSQGEPRAALSRIAADDHPNVSLGSGDTVIFSSRVIPGNESAIGELQNKLSRRGIKIITWADAFVHVSGHPARDELARMYQHVRPRIAVPVHGEARHLIAHAALAETCQVAETVVAENGAIVRLAPGPAGTIGQVQSGRLYVDGSRLVAADGDAVRGRHRVAYNGTAMVTIVVDGIGKLVDRPQISHMGLLDGPDEELEKTIHEAVENAVRKLPAVSRRDDDTIGEAARLAARRAFREGLGKKPQTQVHVVRIGKEN